MRAHVSRKMVMAERVSVFVRANPPSDPGHQAAVKRFEDRAAEAGALLVRQTDGRLAAKAARAKRQTLRQLIDEHYVRHLVTVADRASELDPNRFGPFQRPTIRVSNLAFASKVRSMLAAAQEAAEVLKPLGLGETFLADLARVLDEFDRLNHEASESRADHVAATKELEEVAGEMMEAVSVLDGMYRYRFREDGDRLAQWFNVRDVANPSRSRAPASPPPPAEVKGGADKAA